MCMSFAFSMCCLTSLASVAHIADNYTIGIIDTIFQNNYDSLFINLNEIVIVQPKTTKEITPVQELSSKDLQRLNAHSVADAVRYFSGMQLKDYGGIGGLKTIDVRAMGSSHVGVFYDGVEIGNAQNGIVDLGRYSLDNLESVSLYNGQKSNVLQSAKDYASASALYLKSKKPQFKDHSNTNMQITLKGGSFDLFNPSVLWSQKINENVSSSTNAEFTSSSGKYKYTYSDNWWTGNGYSTTDKRKNGDIEIFRAEQALFGAHANTQWQSKLYAYKSNRGYPGAVIRDSQNTLKHQDRQKDLNLFAQASAKHSFGAKITSQLLAKYAYDKIDYQADSTVMILQSRYKLHDLYMSTSTMIAPTNWSSINFSADYQYNKMNSDIKNFIYPQRHTLYAAVAPAAYWNRLKMQASLLYMATVDKSKILINNNSNNNNSKHKTTKQNKLSPSFVLSYQPFDNKQFIVRYFYKDVFRMPTFSELYMSYNGTLSSFLKPESAKQNNLGISYSKQITPKIGIETTTDVYANRVKNKIIAIGGGANFRWSMMNKGLVKIKGADISFATNYTPSDDVKLTVKSSYAHQSARDFTPKKVQSDTLTYKGQIAYIPQNSGSLVLSGTCKAWDFNISSIFTGVRYKSSDNNASTRMPPWATQDASASYNRKLFGMQARLTIEINNITNKQYEVVSRYPMPGTNLKFIMRLII